MVKIGNNQEINLWTDVDKGTEVMARRWVYWMLAYFLKEVELHTAIAFKSACSAAHRSFQPAPLSIE